MKRYSHGGLDHIEIGSFQGHVVDSPSKKYSIAWSDIDYRGGREYQIISGNEIILKEQAGKFISSAGINDYGLFFLETTELSVSEIIVLQSSGEKASTQTFDFTQYP